MPFKSLRCILIVMLGLSGLYSRAATVDSLDVPSAVMNKTYKAAVVLPASYAGSTASYPVLYLLHGGSGHFRDWLNLLPVIIDCGVDDFLIEINRELHRRLVYNNTPHDYTERPGGHTWAYWQNALPYHLIFFHNILKNNGVTVN